MLMGPHVRNTVSWGPSGGTLFPTCPCTASRASHTGKPCLGPPIWKLGAQWTVEAFSEYYWMHECHVSLRTSSCTWSCSSSNCTQELNLQRLSFTFETLGPIFKGVCVLSLFSCVWLFVTPWTVARQAPLSMGFSRQEYWSGLLCPPVDLPDPGIKLASPMSPASQAGSFPLAPPLVEYLYLVEILFYLFFKFMFY